LAERLGKELDLVRVVWLEGRVAAGIGQTTKAIAAFEQTRREFASRGLAFDYALVSLELSLVLLAENHTAEVRAIAQEMLAIFREQELQPEALTALRIFCDAAKQNAATIELTRSIVLYLHQAQYDPELRFEPRRGSRRRESASPPR
jgi:hypothetical protein